MRGFVSRTDVNGTTTFTYDWLNNPATHFYTRMPGRHVAPDTFDRDAPEGESQRERDETRHRAR